MFLRKILTVVSFICFVSTGFSQTSGIKVESNPKGDLAQEQALFIKAWQPHLKDNALKSKQIKDPSSFVVNNAKSFARSIKSGDMHIFRASQANKVVMSFIYNDKADPTMGPQAVFLRVMVFANSLNKADARWVWNQFVKNIAKTQPNKDKIYFVLVKQDNAYSKMLKNFGFVNTHQSFKPSGNYPPLNTRSMDVWVYSI